ncbi:O-antigen ligase family protein [Candidatus Uhrbacteria bacterium]|nr:O-antigen ligase family protein [Candidatus Uhrbacteria bacterium]
MIQKFANGLYLLAIFLLPWQTQVILSVGTVSGEPSAYAVLGITVVEVMLLCVYLLRMHRPKEMETRRIGRALYLFLAATFFSLSASRFSSVGWFHMVHVVSAAIFFFLLIDERTKLKPVLVAFLLGLLVPISLGWFQVLTGASPDSTLLGIAAKDAQTLGVSVVETVSGRMLRAYGTFPHPNIFGGYLAVGVVALAWLTRFVKKKWELAFMLIGSALLGLTLIVTFSRSAWLGITIGLIVLIALMVRDRKMPSRQALPIIGLGVICLLATIAIFHTEVFARFNPTLRLEAVSIEERTSQYQTFGDVFLSSPILGVGPNAYTFTLADQDPGQPVWSYQPIHNVFLLILGELGLVGFSLFLFWIGRIGHISLMSMQTPDGMFAVTLGVSLFVIAVFDHYLWTLWPGLALSAFALALIVRWSKSEARLPYYGS